jgi:hypothetical protein
MRAHVIQSVNTIFRTTDHDRSPAELDADHLSLGKLREIAGDVPSYFAH